MYNKCDSLTSRHKITLDRLTCHENQPINNEFKSLNVPKYQPSDDLCLFIRLILTLSFNLSVAIYLFFTLAVGICVFQV